MKRKVKFGVFADLHVDIIHDGEERLRIFLDKCRQEDVDFIVQLGDFCYPDDGRKCICEPKNRPINIENSLNVKTYADKDKIIGLFRDFEKPSYHVIGNHDCDMCSKKQILEYYGVDYEPNYSFDIGGFHFVVLDPNYYTMDGVCFSFENGNYFDQSYHHQRVLPVLPQEQLEWLKGDLENTTLPTILFSHQGLTENMPADILNAKEVKAILKNAPAGVLASFNGHSHIDYESCEDDIWFININSMSNQWLDVDFICEARYTKEIDEKYPNIKYTVPYRDSVFAIVTLDDTGIDIKGEKSQFVGITPEEQGLYKEGTWWSRAYKGKVYSSPSIQSRYLPFKRNGSMIG